MTKNLITGTILIALALIFNGCNSKKTPAQEIIVPITSSFFGIAPEGDSVQLFTLNSNQLSVKITNFGGIVTEIHCVDKNGEMGNVVLGYDNLDQYLEEHPYFGAIIGRYGNRIAKGSFELDGEMYSLAINNGNNTLHGGLKGFDKVVWDAKMVDTEYGKGLQLSYLSKDMEEGYPGNLQVKVLYEVINNELNISYFATTDKATPINLTNHSYFNLSNSGTILDHVLQINAEGYIPVNSELIPSGAIAAVEETPFDFREPKVIGQDFADVDGGYDHTFALKRDSDDCMRIAILADPKSGREVHVYTTEPGVQFYSGNFLDGSQVSGDISYEKNFGMCLETQHFPDSPNQPNFPNTILEPGEDFQSKTIYKFKVVKE